MSVSYRQRVRDPNARRSTVLDREPAPSQSHRPNADLVKVAQLPDVYVSRPIIVANPLQPRTSWRPQDWLVLPGLLAGCLVVAVLLAVASPGQPLGGMAQAAPAPERPLLRVEEKPRLVRLARLDHTLALEPAPLLELAPEPEPVAVVETPKLRAPRGSYGTAVTFRDNPADAARMAQLEDKIWFVVTVSGNFEESCFT